MGENFDSDSQLGNENLFNEGDDDKECLWLSSDDASTTSFFEEYRLSTSLHFFVDEWLISWLSTLANSYLYLDKASSSLRHENEMKVASSKEELSSDEEYHAVLKPPWNCSAESRSSFESFASCSSASSQVSDSDRLSFQISLVNLDDDEDNNWVSEAEFDCFESGFPSPSWKSNWVGSVLIKPSKPDQPFQKDKISESRDFEADELEEILKSDDDEPFDLQRTHWSSEETWKQFPMSPLKDAIKLGTPPGSHSKPVGSEFHSWKINSKEGCRRRLVFGSGSAASKVLELKQRKVSNSSVKRSTRNLPSRLRKSNKVPIQVVPPEKDVIQQLELKNLQRDLLDDDFVSSGDFQIETLLGLGEFDGHEGIDAEFNEEIFTLDDSF